MTELPGVGGFIGQQKTVLLVVCRHEAFSLRCRIKELEPKSFLVITNSSEIIGRGFQAQ